MVGRWAGRASRREAASTGDEKSREDLAPVGLIGLGHRISLSLYVYN
jgi:hypothetical protein